jgi:F-type H+-transporting ATPase subunit epsilon
LAFELVVVTPEGEAFSGQVEQVVLPGVSGEFGVLESHERFLTPLVLGPMHIFREAGSGGGSEWAAITGGFAEVDGSRVVVLVDSCALASDIDPDAVRARHAEASDALASLPGSDETAGERERLSTMIARSELELDVAGR